MAKIISDEQKKIQEMKNLYVNQKNRKFDYSIDDFDIFDCQWKHKDWKTWCKGYGRYDKTKELVEQYISECKKPYGKRDLSFIHLA